MTDGQRFQLKLTWPWRPGFTRQDVALHLVVSFFFRKPTVTWKYGMISFCWGYFNLFHKNTLASSFAVMTNTQSFNLKWKDSDNKTLYSWKQHRTCGFAICGGMIGLEGDKLTDGPKGWLNNSTRERVRERPSDKLIDFTWQAVTYLTKSFHSRTVFEWLSKAQYIPLKLPPARASGYASRATGIA